MVDDDMTTSDKSVRVAAVVVTFNRKVLLIECLKALLNQDQPLNRIYLIDNASTDGTPELLREEGLLENSLIEYVRLEENTGGAGGFYEGIKLAHDADYDWIWVMDDDAEPKANALKLLFSEKQISEIEKYSGICGVKMGLDGEPQYAHRGLFMPDFGPRALSKNIAGNEQEISYASFVGLLINAKAVDLIGYPLSDFFIWFDDVEYCQRMMKYGPILYRPASSILHKDNVKNTSESATNLQLPTAVPYALQWKYLCGFRNYIYLMTHHGNKGFLWAFWILLRKIVRILLMDAHKLVLIHFYFLYWKQAVGFSSFCTIKPAEWNALK